MNITSLKLSATNCFVVRAEEDYVLTDTGYEDDWGKFAQN